MGGRCLNRSGQRAGQCGRKSQVKKAENGSADKADGGDLDRGANRPSAGQNNDKRGRCRRYNAIPVDCQAVDEQSGQRLSGTVFRWILTPCRNADFARSAPFKRLPRPTFGLRAGTSPADDYKPPVLISWGTHLIRRSAARMAPLAGHPLWAPFGVGKPLRCIGGRLVRQH